MKIFKTYSRKYLFGIFLQVTLFISIFFYSCGSITPSNPNPPPGNADTTFSSYIILTPASGPADTLHFTERTVCTGTYFTAQHNTYCLMRDTVTSQSLSLTFAGNTTGSPAFTFGFLSYMSGSYNGSGITGTVTIYEAVGGKIKGTFAGTFSDGTTSYQGRGVFTVRRIQ